MGRPKLEYADGLIGTLQVTERVRGTKHARFRYSCTVCSFSGEADARYLSKGCAACRNVSSVVAKPDDIQVVTPLESYTVTKLQLVVTLREQKHAMYYYRGKRVRLEETEYGVRFSQPAINGVETWVALDKLAQELGEHSIVKPDPTETQTQTEPQDPLDPWADPQTVQTGQDGLRPLPADFSPPEGSVKLVKLADRVWLDENYTPEDEAPPPPQYLVDWMRGLPANSAMRFVPCGSEGYAAFTPAPKPLYSSTLDFTDMEDEHYLLSQAPEEKARVAAQIASWNRQAEEHADYTAGRANPKPTPIKTEAEASQTVVQLDQRRPL